MAKQQRWEVHADGLNGPEVVIVTGEMALQVSGALAFNVPGKGWVELFSPIGWLRAFPIADAAE